MVGMLPHPRDLLRAATIDDSGQLLRLWDLLFDEAESAAHQPWRGHAKAWFDRTVDDPRSAHFPVVESAGAVVATAIGTLEVGGPDPFCPRGRIVRLVNVFTLPEYRGNGYAATLVREVIEWARMVDADRVDLSATPQGQPIYEGAGFVLTSAPRMKLVLSQS